MSNFFITQEVINLNLIVTENPDHQSGAKSVFEGIVRDCNLGKSVTSLEYQCYEELAVKEGSLIIGEALSKFDINYAYCVHRIGLLNVGDTAVAVLVYAGHRDDSFKACRFIIDEVKTRVPIWKKELYVSGKSDWLQGAG
jgi:molybdopterin synthase catalytic subunit